MTLVLTTRTNHYRTIRDRSHGPAQRGLRLSCLVLPLIFLAFPGAIAAQRGDAPAAAIPFREVSVTDRGTVQMHVADLPLATVLQLLSIELLHWAQHSVNDIDTGKAEDEHGQLPSKAPFLLLATLIDLADTGLSQRDWLLTTRALLGGYHCNLATWAREFTPVLAAQPEAQNGPKWLRKILPNLRAGHQTQQHGRHGIQPAPLAAVSLPVELLMLMVFLGVVFLVLMVAR